MKNIQGTNPFLILLYLPAGPYLEGSKEKIHDIDLIFMDRIRISENKQVVLLICAIYILCILVFWPLMTVLIWSAAIAVALMSFHKRLSGIVKPSVSVTFITLWVLLVILLVLSIASNILYGSIDHIGAMVTSLASGFKNTGFSAFLPTFTEKQISNMPDTLIQLLLQSLLSLSGNIMQSIISIIIFFALILLYLPSGKRNTPGSYHYEGVARRDRV